MIILIGLTVLVIIALIWARASDFYDVFSFFLLLISGTYLTVALISLPIHYSLTKGEIVKFHSVETTLKTARENRNELEKAAIMNEVIRSNKWLMGVQYWNETLFDIWIPDEVMQLKPIR